MVINLLDKPKSLPNSEGFYTIIYLLLLLKLILMKALYIPMLILALFAMPAFGQGLKVLDVVDDGSGELTLNLSLLTSDISSYELFIDGVSYGVFSGGQSSVTIPTPSLGEHLIDITVTSRFSGAQGQVSFILNLIPEEELEAPLVIVPQFLTDAAKFIVDKIPGGEDTVGITTILTTTAVAASSAVSAVSIFTSLADMVNYLVHVFISILELIGIKKRSKPWGTVYDSLTKRPLPFSKVKLMDQHSRVLETKIADKEGRYGFLISPESLTGEGLEIQIMAEKRGYSFPSKKVSPPHDTILYENVYTGGIVKIQTASAANFDLPMDPLKVTAKELAKIPKMKLHNTFTRIADIGFWVGLVTAPLSFIADPNLFSFAVLVVFLILAFFRIFGLRERPFGVVMDDTVRKPMSFALITLNDVQGARKGFTVSDEQGRYFLVTEKGEFDLNIFTPADIAPQRSTKEHIISKRGWIAQEVHL